jgi:hypothetical protein
MSAHAIDQLSKGLALGVSRRGMLKTLGALVGATAVGVALAPKHAEAVGGCGTCPQGTVCCKAKGGGGGWACRHPGQCA